MHNYLFDIETVRIAIIAGVALTMLFYERLHLTTGGAIVPGYLALFVPTPLFIAVTVATGYVTYLVVKYVIRRRVILYGRRKFETEILVALTLVSACTVAAHLLVDVHPYVMALFGVGFIIPGIIAHDMDRQTPLKTLGVLALNTAVLIAFMFVFQALLDMVHEAPMPRFMLDTAYPPELILLGVIASVITGMILYRVKDVRSGGFVTGAYLAFVLTRPLDILFVLVAAGITYLLVTRVMKRYMMIFGRRKFSAMILAGAVVTWGLELLLALVTQTAYIPWRGFNVIALVLPALLANDSERQGVPATLAGATVSALTVFIVLQLAARIRSAYLLA